MSPSLVYILSAKKRTRASYLTRVNGVSHLSLWHFDEIEDFLLTLSEFCLRHVSVMVSDILCVGSGIDNGLKLGWSGFENGFQFFLITIQGFGLIADACESATILPSAALLCCMYNSDALGVLVIAKGMLRLLTTAFTKILNAVFALMPNCSQSASNLDFISESNLTVTADCAIINHLNNYNDCILPSFWLQIHGISTIPTNF